MILPTDILPSALGIRWGMTREECLAALNVTPFREAATWAAVRLPIAGELYEVVLRFDNEIGLTRVDVDLYVSRSFWDWKDYTADHSGTGKIIPLRRWNAVLTEYHGYYLQLVDNAVAVLGPPDFSGRYGQAGYPEDQVADYLTYWDRVEGRMRIEDWWPNKEFPVYVRFVCCSNANRPGI